MTMAQDNWLSTDAMIAEVCDDAVKKYGGTNILAIRCPDKEIEAKVRKYLNSKRGGKTIDTYVGGINDPIKAVPYDGDITPDGDGTPKRTRKKREPTPVDDTPMTMDEALEADGEKLAALTGEDHGPFDITGLVGDDPDLGGLV